jgi:hypothetical protein
MQEIFKIMSVLGSQSCKSCKFKVIEFNVCTRCLLEQMNSTFKVTARNRVCFNIKMFNVGFVCTNICMCMYARSEFVLFFSVFPLPKRLGVEVIIKV